MSFKVHLRPEAEADVEEAAIWYEKQRQSLGNEFLDEVLKSIKLISRNPKHYPVIYRQTRRMVIQRFPFNIYYRFEVDSIVVIAILHGSRDPNRWKERVKL